MAAPEETARCRKNSRSGYKRKMNMLKFDVNEFPSVREEQRLAEERASKPKTKSEDYESSLFLAHMTFGVAITLLVIISKLFDVLFCSECSFVTDNMD